MGPRTMWRQMFGCVAHILFVCLLMMACENSRALTFYMINFHMQSECSCCLEITRERSLDVYFRGKGVFSGYFILNHPQLIHYVNMMGTCNRITFIEFETWVGGWPFRGAHFFSSHFNSFHSEWKRFENFKANSKNFMGLGFASRRRQQCSGCGGCDHT